MNSLHIPGGIHPALPSLNVHSPPTLSVCLLSGPSKAGLPHFPVLHCGVLSTGLQLPQKTVMLVKAICLESMVYPWAWHRARGGKYLLFR